jgi:hypothetical protein
MSVHCSRGCTTALLKLPTPTLSLISRNASLAVGSLIAKALQFSIDIVDNCVYIAHGKRQLCNKTTSKTRDMWWYVLTSKMAVGQFA